MNCPNHPAGRICSACDPPAQPITAGWLLKFFAMFIPAMILFCFCPLLVLAVIFGAVIIKGVIRFAARTFAEEMRR